jgi:cell division control protein 6
MSQETNLFPEIKNTIFKDLHIFSKTYIPKKILYRDAEINNLVYNLSAVKRSGRPNDTILYGKRGTGKTLVTKYVTGELEKASSDVKIYLINLRGKNTNFKAWKELARVVLGTDVLGRDADYIAHRVFEFITTLEQKYIIFVLDEINEVEVGCDSFLYFLLRPNEVAPNMDSKEITNIFITNSMNFPKNLSEGTHSSFKTVDKYVYHPYNADQLGGILKERAQLGLVASVYDNSILSICAAYGAQEHGDARETIKLLAKAAELAEKEKSTCIMEDHVHKARELVEFDGIAQVLNTLPIQQKTLALACVRVLKKAMKNQPPENKSKSITIYSEYKDICSSLSIEILTYRRINDYFNELETLGLIGSHIVYSRGKTRYITLLVPTDVDKILTDNDRFQSFKPKITQTNLG